MQVRKWNKEIAKIKTYKDSDSTTDNDSQTLDTFIGSECEDVQMKKHTDDDGDHGPDSPSSDISSPDTVDESESSIDNNDLEAKFNANTPPPTPPRTPPSVTTTHASKSPAGSFKSPAGSSKSTSDINLSSVDRIHRPIAMKSPRGAATAVEIPTNTSPVQPSPIQLTTERTKPFTAGKTIKMPGKTPRMSTPSTNLSNPIPSQQQYQKQLQTQSVAGATNPLVAGTDSPAIASKPPGLSNQNNNNNNNSNSPQNLTKNTTNSEQLPHSQSPNVDNKKGVPSINDDKKLVNNNATHGNDNGSNKNITSIDSSSLVKGAPDIPTIPNLVNNVSNTNQSSNLNSNSLGAVPTPQASNVNLTSQQSTPSNIPNHLHLPILSNSKPPSSVNQTQTSQMNKINSMNNSNSSSNNTFNLQNSEFLMGTNPNTSFVANNINNQPQTNQITFTETTPLHFINATPGNPNPKNTTIPAPAPVTTCTQTSTNSAQNTLPSVGSTNSTSASASSSFHLLPNPNPPTQKQVSIEVKKTPEVSAQQVKTKQAASDQPTKVIPHRQLSNVNYDAEHISFSSLDYIPGDEFIVGDEFLVDNPADASDDEEFVPDDPNGEPEVEMEVQPKRVVTKVRRKPNRDKKSFRTVAYEVLKKENRPLPAKEIVAIALRDGL